jgi:hypothetical protein
MMNRAIANRLTLSKTERRLCSETAIVAFYHLLGGMSETGETGVHL